MTGIDPAIVAFLQPANVDLADATHRRRRDPDALRQVNGSLSDAAIDPHIVTALGMAAKIRVYFPGSDIESDTAKVQAAQVQVRLASAHLYHQIHSNGVIEAHVPLALPVLGCPRGMNFDIASHAGRVIIH